MSYALYVLITLTEINNIKYILKGLGATWRNHKLICNPQSDSQLKIKASA